MDVLGRDKETNEIEKARYAVYGEIYYGSTAKLPLLPQVGKNKDFVLKGLFLYDTKNKDNPWKRDGIEVVTKQGELDYYRGAASETKLTMSKSEIENWDTMSFIKFLRLFKFRKRFNIPVNIGKGYASIRNKQVKVPSLLKNNYQDIGGHIGSYLTIELDLSKIKEDDDV